MLTYARVCSRMLTYAHVRSRTLTYAHVCSRMLPLWALSTAGPAAALLQTSLLRQLLSFSFGLKCAEIEASERCRLTLLLCKAVCFV